MEQIIIEASIRKETGRGKVNRLRRSSYIPCVVYGQGKDPQNLQVVTKDFLRLIASHKGGSFVVSLRVKDEKAGKDRAVIIKGIQYHPVTDQILHVDFNEISLTKAIKVKVPLVAKGESIGVKQDGGVLDHILWELDIECLPTQIPESIEVDVSGLKIGDSLHVKDIVAPGGVKILNDKESTLLSVGMPKEEAAPAVEEAAAGEVKAEPEVIKEKKDKLQEESAEEKGKEKDKKEKDKAEK